MLFGIQSTAISLLIGAAGTGYFYVQTVKLERDLNAADTQLQAQMQLSQVLQEQVEQQKSVIGTFEAIQRQTEQQIQTLTEERNQANERTASAQQEIADLRASEKSSALQDPYGRGNSAAKRLNDSLQRIAGKEDNNG